jgi:hypothetical protein
MIFSQNETTKGSGRTSARFTSASGFTEPCAGVPTF